jgi:hypothetical protein
MVAIGKKSENKMNIYSILIFTREASQNHDWKSAQFDAPEQIAVD